MTNKHPLILSLLVLFTLSCEQKDYSEELKEIRDDLQVLKRVVKEGNSVLSDIKYHSVKMEYSLLGRNYNAPDDESRLMITFHMTYPTIWDSRSFVFKDDMKNANSQKELDELVQYLKLKVVGLPLKFGIFKDASKNPNVMQEMASLKNFIKIKDKIGLTTFQYWLERFFIGAGYTNSVYINPRNQLQQDSYEKEYHYYHKPFFKQIK
jgi:hypothetical protein